MRRILFLTLFALGALAPAVAAAEGDIAVSLLDQKPEAFRELLENGILLSREGAVSVSPITRKEFVRAVVRAAFDEKFIAPRCLEDLDSDARPGLQYNLLFWDVDIHADYALELCVAMRTGMVWGYSDGRFDPYKTVNYAEAAKILSIAFALDYDMEEYPGRHPWYVTYEESMARAGAAPSGARHTDVMTTQHTSAMLSVLLEHRNRRLAARLEKLHASGLQPPAEVTGSPLRV